MIHFMVSFLAFLLMSKYAEQGKCQDNKIKYRQTYGMDYMLSENSIKVYFSKMLEHLYWTTRDFTCHFEVHNLFKYVS